MATTKKITLKQARESAGLETMQDLAEESGISITTIRGIENNIGEFKTSYDVAIALAKAVGLEISDIKWPRGLSNLGRPAKSGHPLVLKRTITITIVEELLVCDKCHLALPASTRECDYCS